MGDSHATNSYHTNKQLLKEYTMSFIILALIIGLCIGSFLNVVIYRLPIILQHHSRDEPAPFSLALPPSHCPHCHHRLQWWQNIPLLSFIILRGKCTHCQTLILWRYPLVEALTAIAFGGLVMIYGIHITAILAMIFTAFLLVLLFIDVEHLLLPDSLTLPLLWLGLLVNLFGYFTSLQSAVIGAAVGYLVLWVLFWAFKLITGKEGLGYGDFKLLAALGAWCGWQALPWILVLAALITLVVAISARFMRQRPLMQRFPFGPGLAIGGWYVVVYGHELMRWYLQISGLAH